jgi:type VI secretion system protein ImpA
MPGVASPSDLRGLLDPLSVGENCGPPPFSLREELDRARRGRSGDGQSAGDQKSPKRARAGDWEKVIRVCREWLSHKSKDFGLAARLTEALTKAHGLAGLREGLGLLRKFVEDFWEVLLPPPDPEEGYEGRLAVLRWLDDADRGALFPVTVRAVPLARERPRGVSWLEWKRLHDRNDAAAWKAFEQSLAGLTYAECLSVVGDLELAGSELDGLVLAVRERSGQHDFDMPALRQAVRDCEDFARQLLERCPAPVVAEDPGGAAGVQGALDDREGEPAPGGDDPTWAGEVAGHPLVYSREQIYELIGELAAELKQIEPHSPVPYLLDRAVELGSMPFPRLMKELIKDGPALGKISQEFGIKEGM